MAFTKPGWKPDFKSICTIIIASAAEISPNLIHGDLNIAQAASQLSSGDVAVPTTMGIVAQVFMAGIPEEVMQSTPSNKS